MPSMTDVRHSMAKTVRCVGREGGAEQSATLQLVINHVQLLHMVNLTHLISYAPSPFPWDKAKTIPSALEERRICWDYRKVESGLAGDERAVLMGAFVPVCLRQREREVLLHARLPFLYPHPWGPISSSLDPCSPTPGWNE